MAFDPKVLLSWQFITLLALLLVFVIAVLIIMLYWRKTQKPKTPSPFWSIAVVSLGLAYLIVLLDYTGVWGAEGMDFSKSWKGVALYGLLLIVVIVSYIVIVQKIHPKSYTRLERVARFFLSARLQEVGDGLYKGGADVVPLPRFLETPNVFGLMLAVFIFYTASRKEVLIAVDAITERVKYWEVDPSYNSRKAFFDTELRNFSQAERERILQGMQIVTQPSSPQPPQEGPSRA